MINFLHENETIPQRLRSGTWASGGTFFISTHAVEFLIFVMKRNRRQYFVNPSNHPDLFLLQPLRLTVNCFNPKPYNCKCLWLSGHSSTNWSTESHMTELAFSNWPLVFQNESAQTEVLLRFCVFSGAFSDLKEITRNACLLCVCLRRQRGGAAHSLHIATDMNVCALCEGSILFVVSFSPSTFSKNHSTVVVFYLSVQWFCQMMPQL